MVPCDHSLGGDCTEQGSVLRSQVATQSIQCDIGDANTTLKGIHVAHLVLEELVFFGNSGRLSNQISSVSAGIQRLSSK